MREIVFVEKQRVTNLDKHQKKFLNIIPLFEQSLEIILDVYNMENIYSVGTYEDYNSGAMPLFQQKTYWSKEKGSMLILSALNQRFDGGVCMNDNVYEHFIFPASNIASKKNLFGFVRFDGPSDFMINVEDQLSHYLGPLVPYGGFPYISLEEANKTLTSGENPLDPLPFLPKLYK